MNSSPFLYFFMLIVLLLIVLGAAALIKRVKAIRCLWSFRALNITKSLAPLINFYDEGIHSAIDVIVVRRNDDENVTIWVDGPGCPLTDQQLEELHRLVKSVDHEKEIAVARFDNSRLTIWVDLYASQFKERQGADDKEHRDFFTIQNMDDEARLLMHLRSTRHATFVSEFSSGKRSIEVFVLAQGK